MGGFELGPWRMGASSMSVSSRGASSHSVGWSTMSSLVKWRDLLMVSWPSHSTCVTPERMMRVSSSEACLTASWMLGSPGPPIFNPAMNPNEMFFTIAINTSSFS